MYGLKTDWFEEEKACFCTLEDYEGAVARWCPGCGDHAVLAGVQRLCRDKQLPREKTVFVSGIGCSSRFPHYMATYGFHGLHGRAFPVACGVKSRRPDLNVFLATGDGDCCSIGAGHWVHAVRYNMDMVAMLFDNNCYGLTKNQTSPTAAKGHISNTHPRGAWLEGIDPAQTNLSITNCSFLARVPDWNPALVYAALKAAYEHKGLGFVIFLQRCPHYTDKLFKHMQDDPSTMNLLLSDAMELDEGIQRMFKNQQQHDITDINAAREQAARRDILSVGVLYKNEAHDTYDSFSVEGLGTSREDKLAAVRAELDTYLV